MSEEQEQLYNYLCGIIDTGLTFHPEITDPIEIFENAIIVEHMTRQHYAVTIEVKPLRVPQINYTYKEIQK